METDREAHGPPQFVYKVKPVHCQCHACWFPAFTPSPSWARTCHDILHHGDEVGRLAEGGRVVVLILEEKQTGFRNQGGSGGWLAVPGRHEGEAGHSWH